jgi:Ca2+-binding EF-hand superfamily protein
MGCTVGSKYAEDGGDMILSDELRLSVSEIRKLKNYLLKNCPKAIDTYTFSDFECVDRSILFRKILGFYDINMSGKLSFCQFTCSIWCFLSLNATALDSFLFDLYDEDSTGELNIAEVKHMMRDVHQKKYDNADVQINLRKLEEGRQKQTLISRDQFLQWLEDCPYVITPVLSLFSHARSVIVGCDFWEMLEARRMEEENVRPSDGDRMYRIRTQLRMRDFHNKLCQQLSAQDGTNASLTAGHVQQRNEMRADKLITVSPNGPRLRSRSNSDGEVDNVDHLVACEKGGFLKLKPKPLSRANSLTKPNPNSGKEKPGLLSRTNSLADESRSLMSDVASVISGAGAFLSKQNSKVFSVSDINFEDDQPTPEQQETVIQGGAFSSSKNAVHPAPNGPTGFDFLEAVRRKLEQDLNAPSSAVLKQLECSEPSSPAISGERCCMGGDVIEDYMSDISEDSGTEDRWQVQTKPRAIVRRHNSFSAPVGLTTME